MRGRDTIDSSAVSAGPSNPIPGPLSAPRTVAGADSIADLAILRHGAVGTLFDRPYAPSTLGSFLRQARFGHVRQLDASRLPCALTDHTPVLAWEEAWNTPFHSMFDPSRCFRRVRLRER